MNIDEATAATTITTTYRWTVDECIRSFAWKDREDGRALLRLIGRTLLILFVPFLLFFIVVLSFVSPGSLLDFGSWADGLAKSAGTLAEILGLVALILGTPFLLSGFIPRWIHRRKVRKYFAAHPEAETNITVTADAQTWRWDFGDGTQVAIEWQRYVNVVKAREGFSFLAVDERTWDKQIGDVRTWIPMHAFRSEQEIALLGQWAQAYVRYYREVD